MTNDEMILRGGGNYSSRLMEELEDKRKKEEERCDCGKEKAWDEDKCPECQGRDKCQTSEI